MNGVLSFILASVFMLGAQTAQALSPQLQSSHERIIHKYNAVTHMDISEFLKQQQEQPATLLVFDVRKQEEFDVSHIEGALRVDPKISRRSFLKTYEKQLQGKIIILYCSVGYRSSNLAEKLQSSLKQKGAIGVYNLRGGLFAWHNQKRPLVNNAGTTDLIHPYNKKWQSLVVRSDKISYTPGH